MTRNLQHAVIAYALFVAGVTALYFTLLFAWITADPPVGVPGGGSRRHTGEELQFATFYAISAFTVLSVAVIGFVVNLLLWRKGRSASGS